MAASRPVIGLTTYQEQARFTVWDVHSVLLPVKYVQSVLAAGGVPVLLPSVPNLPNLPDRPEVADLPEVIEAVLPRLDGLILSGGADIDPARYGAAPLETTGPPREDRDAAEFGLFAAAVEAGLPVLGICRGLQLINVARGGTLHQHLPAVLGHSDHAPAPAVYGVHPVIVTPDSALATILGRTELDAPSYHHQGIDRLGSGLRVTATAKDGTIEAIEDPDLPFCLAVQWHPEVGDDVSLFAALVEAAAARAAR